MIADYEVMLDKIVNKYGHEAKETISFAQVLEHASDSKWDRACVGIAFAAFMANGGNKK